MFAGAHATPSQSVDEVTEGHAFADVAAAHDAAESHEDLRLCHHADVPKLAHAALAKATQINHCHNKDALVGAIVVLEFVGKKKQITCQLSF